MFRWRSCHCVKNIRAFRCKLIFFNLLRFPLLICTHPLQGANFNTKTRRKRSVVLDGHWFRDVFSMITSFVYISCTEENSYIIVTLLYFRDERITKYTLHKFNKVIMFVNCWLTNSVSHLQWFTNWRQEIEIRIKFRAVAMLSLHNLRNIARILLHLFSVTH